MDRFVVRLSDDQSSSSKVRPCLDNVGYSIPPPLSPSPSPPPPPPLPLPLPLSLSSYFPLFLGGKLPHKKNPGLTV